MPKTNQQAATEKLVELCNSELQYDLSGDTSNNAAIWKEFEGSVETLIKEGAKPYEKVKVESGKMLSAMDALSGNQTITDHFLDYVPQMEQRFKEVFEKQKSDARQAEERSGPKISERKPSFQRVKDAASAAKGRLVKQFSAAPALKNNEESDTKDKNNDQSSRVNNGAADQQQSDASKPDKPAGRFVNSLRRVASAGRLVRRNSHKQAVLDEKAEKTNGALER